MRSVSGCAVPVSGLRRHAATGGGIHHPRAVSIFIFTPVAFSLLFLGGCYCFSLALDVVVGVLSQLTVEERQRRGVCLWWLPECCLWASFVLE